MPVSPTVPVLPPFLNSRLMTPAARWRHASEATSESVQPCLSAPSQPTPARLPAPISVDSSRASSCSRRLPFSHAHTRSSGAWSHLTLHWPPPGHLSGLLTGLPTFTAVPKVHLQHSSQSDPCIARTRCCVVTQSPAVAPCHHCKVQTLSGADGAPYSLPPPDSSPGLSTLGFLLLPEHTRHQVPRGLCTAFPCA